MDRNIKDTCIISKRGYKGDKNRKRPDGIPFTIWKCLGNVRVTSLINLFNKILKIKKVLNEWRKSKTILIYKNKYGTENYSNIMVSNLWTIL